MNALNKQLNRDLSSPVGSIIVLLAEWWVLNKYILWFDLSRIKESTRQPYEDRIMIELTPLHHITVPKNEIKSGIVYDCYVGGETIPRFRFRLWNKQKLTQSKSKSITPDDHSNNVDDVTTNDLPHRKWWIVHMPNIVHIKESPDQTIWKREKIMESVRAMVKKMPNRKK